MGLFVFFKKNVANDLVRDDVSLSEQIQNLAN